MKTIQKMLTQKKALEQMWWLIMAAAIAIIAAILIILWFRGAGGQGFGFLEGKIGELDDCDKDKVADLFDNCVCTPGERDGCPEGTTKDPDGKEKPDCCVK